MMEASVILNLKNIVRELGEINISKEKLAHDVKNVALNFLRSSFEYSTEEVKGVVNSLNTNSRSSLISRIFEAAVSSKVQRNEAKKEIEHEDSNKDTSDKASLRQKMQELRSTTYTTEEDQSRSSRSSRS
jgi:hypothetical protein